MPLKLIIDNPEKIRLFDPNQPANLKIYLLTPIVILLIISPLLYLVGIFHPSYQIYCEEKKDSLATGCKLKSTYYFTIPWDTYLGNITYAYFQINSNTRLNKKPNNCGEIALLTKTATNPLSYSVENQKTFTFYLSCYNLAKLREIANEINNYLREKNVKKFNIPSIPIPFVFYLWAIGIVLIFIYKNKRVEVIFDKKFGLVTIKTVWFISRTKTYPLHYIKKIYFHQTKNGRRHLILNLAFEMIDLGDVSDMSKLEQNYFYHSINDFLDLKGKSM